MNATTLESARLLVRGAEEREQLRYGGTRVEARKRLARRIGIMPGTLYNLAYERLKRLDERVRDRIAAYVVADLNDEIERLSRDLETARTLGSAQDPKLVRQIAEVLKRAQALHNEIVGAPGA